MPKAKPEPKVPFSPVTDPQSIKLDPVNSRALDLFDALRRRMVSPERAAYVVSQVHANSSQNAHAK